MKKDNDDQKKKNNVVHIGQSSHKPKKDKVDKETKSQKGKDIFVTDERFRYAMDLVREDMNNALNLANSANNSNFFLLKFLVKKNIIEQKEFEEFVASELEKITKS